MSSTPETVIEVSDLVKIYGGDTRAVDQVSFDVDRGELFGFLGPERSRQDHDHPHPRHAAEADVRRGPRRRVRRGGRRRRGEEAARPRHADADPRRVLDRARDARAGGPAAPHAEARDPQPHRRAPPADGSRGGREEAHRNVLGRDEAPSRPRGAPSCTGPRSSSWTSPPRASTPRVAPPCGRSSSASTPRARRCSSRPTTWRRPTASARGWRSSTTATWWSKAGRTRSRPASAPTRWSCSSAEREQRADGDRRGHDGTARRGRRPSSAGCSTAWCRARPWPPTPRASRCPCPNAERAIPALLRRLDGNGLDISGLQMSQPSLDDVFLKYTGRHIREEAADQPIIMGF